MAPDTPAKQQATRFLLLYALAAAGGAIGYVPFLTILFPMLVTELAGDADISWLAYATFAGAIAASVANIAFGWLSDRTRSRRPWIAAGLVLSCLMLVGFARIDTIETAIVWLVLWQLTLNMMLSPLAAWAGDCIPDGQKGLLGGMLSFAPAAGAIATAFVTLPGLAGADGRLVWVAALVFACVLPALLFGAPRDFPDLMRDDRAPESDKLMPHRSRGTVVRMWVARLLIQISEAALFAYLYFWFRTVDPAMTDARVAQVFSIILVISVPLALLAGSWADRRHRPFLPLPVAALVSAGGLIMMAASTSLVSALAGYVVFGVAASIFLALHTGQTLRVLPKPANRGRDLGIFNLTNTSPSLIMPWLTLALVPVFGFSGLFVALALCAAIAALLLVTIPKHG